MCEGSTCIPKCIAWAQQGFPPGRLCSAEWSSDVQTGRNGDAQSICKSHSGASLWKLSVFWALLGQGPHPQAPPVSWAIPCCLTERDFQIISHRGSVQLLKYRNYECHLRWLSEGPLAIHMGLCIWETLHTPRAAFMEDLYTMISNYLTKPPVYTRTISTVRT